MAQVFRRSQRVRSVDEAGAAHRNDGFLEELVGFQARIAPTPQADRRVEAVSIEVHEPEAGRHPHIDLRVRGVESLQPRHQPLGGECRRDAQLKRSP